MYQSGLTPFETQATIGRPRLNKDNHQPSILYPTHQPIEHWHRVYTPEEMEAKALELLSDPGTDYSPVYPYSMEDNAASVMQLFCGSEGGRQLFCDPENARRPN